jgi:hypothetical protein
MVMFVPFLGLVFILTMSSICYAEPVSLQRLFISAEERVLIEQQKRQASLKPDAMAQQKRQDVAATDRIALDALLIGYRNAIWVNQKMIDKVTEINGILIDPKNATKKGLWIITPSGRKYLKQGQVYLTESGKVVERYEAI